jgi:hypothetical protein
MIRIRRIVNRIPRFFNDIVYLLDLASIAGETCHIDCFLHHNFQVFYCVGDLPVGHSLEHCSNWRWLRRRHMYTRDDRGRCGHIFDVILNGYPDLLRGTRHLKMIWDWREAGSTKTNVVKRAVSKL